MSWWRRNWRLVLALSVGALGLIVVAILYALRKRSQVKELQAQLGLMTATAKVAGLEADKKARASELAVNADKARRLDAEILQAKKVAVSVVESVKELSDAQVLEAFQRLGY